MCPVFQIMTFRRRRFLRCVKTYTKTHSKRNPRKRFRAVTLFFSQTYFKQSVPHLFVCVTNRHTHTHTCTHRQTNTQTHTHKHSMEICCVLHVLHVFLSLHIFGHRWTKFLLLIACGSQSRCLRLSVKLPGQCSKCLTERIFYGERRNMRKTKQN